MCVRQNGLSVSNVSSVPVDFTRVVMVQLFLLSNAVADPFNN